MQNLASTIGSKDHTKDKRKDINKGENNTGKKRNSQPAVIPIENKDKNKKIRRELSYSLDARNNIRLEETDPRTPENTGNTRRKGREVSSKSNNKKKEEL